ncbi:MAG: tetratricopeptide repeat protein, partial [Phycisphaerae bacterium]|nr:tetratricopeptide repeat protein [Phycisphaerae bacterium]NIW45819.1 tetratricopeptide repeat protein [Gammaproteobacteria bacterium]NIX02625.1 tetratricopeptide repeat protein [Phycisphaerae bacterium]NIX30998.1 tetratricopeptide repeat protein [Phycisphaerae bacterium]
EQRLSWKGTDSTNAYDMFIKGRHQEQSFSREGNAEAIRFYQRAIEIDPSYAMPYARMANMYDNNARIGWSNDPQSDTAKAIEYAKKSIELDDMNPFAYWTQGRIFSRVRSGGIKNQFKAVEALERAIELDPSYADAYGYLSYLYVGIGRIDEALSAIETAIDLNPQYPFWYIQNRAVVRYMQEDYEAAIVDLERSSERSPTVLFVRWWLAAAYAQAGQQDDADWQLEEMMELGFNSTVKELLETSVIHHPPFVELFAAGLQKAGIPEG